MTLLPDVECALNRSAIIAEVVVRACRVEDLPLLEWFGLYRHHREIFADAFARHLRAENVMLVADLGGFPVGQAWIDLTKRQYESIGCIWAVRVFPVVRNLGIGTQLMSCAESQVVRRGYTVAEVGVELDNPDARRLYERLGYRVAAQISEEYGYTTPEGVVARQVVDQWLLRKPVESLARTRAE